MTKKNHKFKIKHLLEHETKRYSLIRFILVLIVLIIYFIFITWRHGIEQGILITLLTWSFFVICTPVADAGLLLDFPLRLITKGRMIVSEVIIWIISFLISISALIFDPGIYDSFIILEIFKKILTNPFPYWSIIILSAIGTFYSIYFADELMDVIKHKERKKYHKHMIGYHLILFIFLIVIILFLYNIMAGGIGLTIGVLLNI